ncbi:MAG: hypothetical protein AAF558_12415 [Verrucomicrobiota bacterium]
MESNSSLPKLQISEDLSFLMPPNESGFDFISVMPFILAVVVIVGLLLWWFLRKSQTQKRLSALFQKAPDVRALEELEAAYQLWPEQGQEWFVYELSGIIRNYLEGRFSCRAPYMTTLEFLSQVHRLPELDETHQKWLEDFLPYCDLVKFAALPVVEDVLTELYQSSRSFIIQSAKNSKQ